MSHRHLLLLVLTGLLPQAELRAAGTCTLLVQVVDEAGNPAARVPVQVTVGKDVRKAPASESGAAEFANLPCGEATVEAGLHAMDRPQFWAATTRTLRPDVPATARLVVVARTEVTIRVLDSKGRPILSGFVSATSVDGTVRLGTPDENGIVKSWLQPGLWDIYWTSEPAGFGQRIYQFGGRVQAQIGREPKTVDLVTKGRERLEGSVFDADGRPIEGVEVIAHQPSTSTSKASARSFANGRFVLDLWEFPIVVEPVASKRDLSFEPPRLSLTEPPTAPVVFVGRPSTRPILRGRVVRKDTAAVVPEVHVQVLPDCGGSLPEGLGLADVSPSMAKTDGNGAFEARCVPECRLRIFASDDAGSGDLELPAAACDREAVVEIEKAKTWILEGTITDRKGVPLEGVPLGLARDPEKPGSTDAVWNPSVFGHSGEGGHFRMEGSLGGRFRLQVTRAGATKDRRDLVLVSKRAPGARFEINLEPEDARTVEVRAISGATVCARALVENVPTPLSQFVLYAEYEDTVVERADARQGARSQDGRLCLDGILPGRYRVRIGNPSLSIPSWYPGNEDRASAMPVALSRGINDLEPVTVRPAGQLHLTLPGWASPDPPRIEYRAPLPEDAPAEAEPSPWTAIPPDLVRGFEGGAAFVTFPVGTWELRACASAPCEKQESAWHSAKPLEVLRSRGGARPETLEPPQAAEAKPPDSP